MTNHANPGEPRPWPLAPLIAYTARSRRVMVHRTSGCVCHQHHTTHVDSGCLNERRFAEIVGTTMRTVQRWHKSGLTDTQADHCAVRVGTHPAMVWPGWIEHGLTEGDRQFVWGSDGCEPGWRHAAGYDERLTEREAA